MKKLDKFLQQCVEDITTAIMVEKAEDNYPHEAYTTVHTNDGWVEIYVSSLHGKHVEVCHAEDENSAKHSDNLANAIMDVLPDWWDVEEEEVCECGVDPGFSSYSEYLDYMYN